MKTEDLDFKIIFECVPGSFLVLDPAFTILAASNDWLSLSGTIREEITGKNIREIFADHPADTDATGMALLSSFETVLRKKIPDSMPGQKYNILRPGGNCEERNWKFFNSPVLNEAGEVRFIIHRVEEELNGLLEKRVKELQQSNLELEQFAYIASHDLREPLRMVTSFLELLKKKYQGQLDATADQYIHFAVNGAERMKTLILNLLEYSRIGSAKNGIETVDLTQLLNYVALVFEPELLLPAAELKIGKLPDVTGQKEQLTQLFQNVIGNAIKYKSEAPLKIEVGCIEKADEWEFFVADNGIGIDEQFNEKIFVIFQRLHSRTEYGGTGIGLSICRKIVECHGGKMWVESSPGNGSTFRFTISKNFHAQTSTPYK
jgi:light-regulated signal transduction histidine kinase (bacteriophytochrome)